MGPTGEGLRAAIVIRPDPGVPKADDMPDIWLCRMSDARSA